MRKFVLPALIAAIVTGAPLQADDQSEPCSAPEYRQFDFWVGNWEVFDSQDAKVGENRIAKVFGGCGLHENWQSAKSAFRGSSYNTYDAVRRVWHQTWIDNAGQLLLLEGGLDDDGRMVLSGERDRRDGSGRVIDRITWTPNADGTIRQHWQASTDGGTTWQTVFDGLYRRLPPEG